MNIEEFKKCVDIYSADLSRWPVDMVKPALAMIEDNTTAQKYFDDLSRIETAMRDIPVREIPVDRFIQNVMSRIGQVAQEDSDDYIYEDIQTEQGIIAHMMARTVAGGDAIIGRAMVVPWTGALMAMAVVGFLVGAQPAQSADLLMDSMFYTVDQIMTSDTDIYNGGIF